MLRGSPPSSRPEVNQAVCPHVHAVAVTPAHSIYLGTVASVMQAESSWLSKPYSDGVPTLVSLSNTHAMGLFHASMWFPLVSCLLLILVHQPAGDVFTSTTTFDVQAGKAT